MNKMSYREIERNYGIPSSTLQSRAKKLGIDTSTGIMLSDFEKLRINKKLVLQKVKVVNTYKVVLTKNSQAYFDLWQNLKLSQFDISVKFSYVIKEL